jgi:hypothetical protein
VVAIFTCFQVVSISNIGLDTVLYCRHIQWFSSVPSVESRYTASNYFTTTSIHFLPRSLLVNHPIILRYRMWASNCVLRYITNKKTDVMTLGTCGVCLIQIYNTQYQWKWNKDKLDLHSSVMLHEVYWWSYWMEGQISDTNWNTVQPKRNNIFNN